VNIYPDLVILAGGFGTRLSPISNGIPKALMPIGGSVYLDLLLQKVFEQTIENIYLSLHYKPELFENYINNSICSDKLSTIIEPKPLGTGGAVSYVIKNTTISSPFFVINGDSLSEIDLNLMAKEFEKNRYKAMIGISEVKDAERYGTVTVQNGNVVSFNEKSISGPGWINNGHYIFSKEVFIGYKDAFSIEKDVFPKLAQNNELGAFKVKNDKFIDIGTPSSYEKLKRRIMES
jgi:D-glycero-alpha-D-manno-heptose 1-phosphate guanylyltransferase